MLADGSLAYLSLHISHLDNIYTTDCGLPFDFELISLTVQRSNVDMHILERWVSTLSMRRLYTKFVPFRKVAGSESALPHNLPEFDLCYHGFVYFAFAASHYIYYEHVGFALVAKFMSSPEARVLCQQSNFRDYRASSW